MLGVDPHEFLVPLIRQSVLMLHLFAFAFAFVLVARADIAMLRGQYQEGRYDLGRDAVYTAWLLGLLWVSGVALIGLGIGFDVAAITANGKVFAKVTVVSILTINGIFLHLYAFPVFADKQGKASSVRLLICTILGAVSSVSWFCASAFGAARVVAPWLGYQHFMLFYGTCLAAGLFVAILFVRPVLRRQLERRSSVVPSAGFVAGAVAE